MIKVQIVIEGQYRENYGSHDWDGKGACPQYWKNKGSAYIIMASNVRLTDAPEVMKEIAERMHEMSYCNDGSECYFSNILMMPNRLSKSEFIEFEFKDYASITSIPQEEVMAFLKAFGEEPEVVDTDAVYEEDRYKKI